MASSWLYLVNNLAEGIQKTKCNCFFEYESVNDSLTKYMCLFCNKYYLNKIGEKLKKWVKNTFRFSKNDINKFILLLKKGVYPYEYIDE